MSTDGKFSDNPMQDIFCSISCEITKQAAEFRSEVEDMICLEWGFKRDDLIARLNELESIKKRAQKLEAERDEANSSLRRMMDENVELVKENGRLLDDNKRLSRDRDAAIGEMEKAYAKYRDLRNRVETLAHRVEEALEEMIGAVYGL